MLPIRTLLFCITLAATAAAQQVPMTKYTDPTTGVSFSYPSVWKQVREVNSYSQAALFGNGQPRAHVVAKFTGSSNVYAHTDLEALDFLFGPIKVSSRDACRKLAKSAGDMDGKKPSEITINGVKFTHGIGGEGSAGHGVDREIYTTFRGGACLVFEEDFSQVSTGLVDGSRPLTPAETRALTRHLQAIMQTVAIAP